jgi:1-acyl-sn-glycerol-3-phosphate acyltransferase
MAQEDTIVIDSSKQTSDSLVRRLIVRPLEFVNTLAALVFFLALMIGAIPVGWVRSLLRPADPELAWSEMAQSIFKFYLYAAGVRLVLDNTHHLPKDPSYGVFAANHASLVDGFIWGAIYPGRPFALTLPSAMIPWPLNFWLKKAGNIAIARDDDERRKYPQLASGQHAVKLSVRTITRQHRSLLIFPEGHVERSRAVQRFHTGAVRIALEAQVPLIPVTIRGSERVFSPNRFMLWPGTITFRLHEPIDVKQYYGKQHDRALVRELTDRVRRSIVRDLPDYYEKRVPQDAE